MAMSDCKTCGALLFSFDVATHKCLPEWKVWHEDTEEQWSTSVYARDAEAAVEKYLEENDCHHDYMVVQDGGRTEFTFFAKRVGEQEPYTLLATGESRPCYFVREKLD